MPTQFFRAGAKLVRRACSRLGTVFQRPQEPTGKAAATGANVNLTRIELSLRDKEMLAINVASLVLHWVHVENNWIREHSFVWPGTHLRLQTETTSI